MALIDLETKALGINGNYQINITSLADGEKAKYREEKGKTYIQINESIYNATDGYKIINVICFGMYYDYQNVQVNFLKSCVITKSYRNIKACHYSRKVNYIQIKKKELHIEKRIV